MSLLDAVRQWDAQMGKKAEYETPTDVQPMQDGVAKKVGEPELKTKDKKDKTITTMNARPIPNDPIEGTMTETVDKKASEIRELWFEISGMDKSSSFSDQIICLDDGLLSDRIDSYLEEKKSEGWDGKDRELFEKQANRLRATLKPLLGASDDAAKATLKPLITNPIPRTVPQASPIQQIQQAVMPRPIPHGPFRTPMGQSRFADSKKFSQIGAPATTQAATQAAGAVDDVAAAAAKQPWWNPNITAGNSLFAAGTGAAGLGIGGWYGLGSGRSQGMDAGYNMAEQDYNQAANNTGMWDRLMQVFTGQKFSPEQVMAGRQMMASKPTAELFNKFYKS